jgi:DNA-binding transcriptional MerR regulator
MTKYSSGQVCRLANTAKTTLFRWEKEGKVPDPTRNSKKKGRRVYTGEQAFQVVTHAFNAQREIAEKHNDREALDKIDENTSLAKFILNADSMGLKELQKREKLRKKTTRTLLQMAAKMKRKSVRYKEIVGLVYRQIEGTTPSP